MTTPEPAPLSSAGFWLHHAALSWRADLAGRLHPLGLTPTQFLHLAAVAQLEEQHGPPIQQEVAERTGSDRMMTSKVVRGLAERGLLARTPTEDDGRAIRLALTASGREVTVEATTIAAEVDVRYFGEDAEALRDRLRSLARAGGVRPAPPPGQGGGGFA
ncbi:MAG: MarR family transcriptional regulator [Pseudonocardia sp.]|nr:MarR family transcriptional regulator [Pseudonocardia sp.]